MKQIIQIDTNRLYAREHFLFMTEVKGLLSSFGASLLQIDSLFDNFLLNYQKHHRNFQEMGLSPHSINLLEESDNKRDDYFWSIALLTRAYTKHIDSKVVDAAYRIEAIINKYGNLKYIPYEEESIQLTKFSNELSKYPSDLNLLHLTEWVKMLNDENEVFKDYYNSIRQELIFLDKIKNFRSNIDGCYDNIVSKINALSLVEKIPVYTDFIDKLNVVINNYIVLYDKAAIKSKTKQVSPPVIPESYY